MKPKECDCGHDKLVEAIARALADAERRGLERAAKVVEEMYLKPERIWDADTLDGAINTIRTQAQANKEEG